MTKSIINKPDFEYTGKENLEIMALAVKYNAEIYKFITRGICENTKILEFGAGRGEYCNRFENQDRMTAIELDKTFFPLLNCAKKYSSIDQMDEKIDLIYTINVMEHIENEQEVIEQFKKVLKKGGLVRVFVPAFQILYCIMDQRVGHFRRYHMGEIIKLFETNGFKTNYASYFDFVGFFAMMWYKYFGNKHGFFEEKPIIFFDKYIFPISRFLDKITFGKILGKNLILEFELK